MSLDIHAIRAEFPALSRTEGGRIVAHLDGPAGTQVPRAVIAATDAVYRDGVANVGGAFGASRDAARVVRSAREAMADFFGGRSDEVVFGQNMTSLTFAFSRAIARDWGTGDRVVITELDHDANRTPWRLAALDRGAAVDEVPFDPASGLLVPERVINAIGPRTRLVAVNAVSNALGSVTALKPIVDAAHAVGALVYVDAVHHSAHRLPDPVGWDADFVAVSAYKFFGPHTGIVWARSGLLADLTPYKVEPAPDSGPGRWETGTQAFESLAGVTAAVDYLAGLGAGTTRRERLVDAFASIARYEETLAGRFLSALGELPGVTVHGPPTVRDRVSTFAVTVDGVSPAEVSRRLGEDGIYTWAGDYYAVRVMERLGLAATGGAVRIGFVHYSTEDEVDRVVGALAAMV